MLDDDPTGTQTVTFTPSTCPAHARPCPWLPRVALTMLDPWYNKGVGGAREDYFEFVHALLSEAARCSDHVMLWGFPEIIWRALNRVPEPLTLIAWLTWTFRNCPSVIRGWRSAQMTCLHFARPGARLHPEHFLNEAQQERQRRGKLRPARRARGGTR